ncbi:exported protein of unknown function [Tenacibaculum sp. 190130A14a]|uniref:RHS repeat-associated core domain-containing protein n=1 Tax=Tenacibaculum polynesiense TaxID=3137857 RepID=A0ABM9PFB6_9FLAO
MKKLLTILFVFALFGAYAQTEQNNETKEERGQRYINEVNPFRHLGYKPKIATLSKGKYREAFPDTLVQIGSFTYNLKSKQITGVIITENLGVSEADLKPEIVSRWMTPDPLSEEFPDMSPYNFTNNNPIFFIDPTGLAPETIYENINTGETVEVNDGINKTIKVSDTDFTKAKFFANEINDKTTTVTIGGKSFEANVINYVSDDIADAYTDFYNEQNSYSEFNISNIADYLFNTPDVKRESDLQLGGGGALELIGGPVKQSVTQIARAAKLVKIQKHHIIPKAIWKKHKAILAPFMEINSVWNLKKLPTPFHGNHPQYNKYVGNQIERLINEGSLSKKAIRGLQKNLNKQLNQAYDSGIKLNDYFRKLNN